MSVTASVTECVTSSVTGPVTLPVTHLGYARCQNAVNPSIYAVFLGVLLSNSSSGAIDFPIQYVYRKLELVLM